MNRSSDRRTVSLLAGLAAAWMLGVAGCAEAPKAAPVAQAAPAPSAAVAPPAAPASLPPSPSPSISQPRQECLAALDKLSAGIPSAETGPALRARGLRIVNPIIVPKEMLADPSIVSGARVRVMIDAKGQPVPGSVVVQQAMGDPQLALAMTDAVPASLRFDVSGAQNVPSQFPFTTVYVVCVQQ
jgi:hypothetical protein